ncbi:tape measure protein [Phenylobacterium ferrooxidans]|uniref:Tape measure protein n=1 Tax=Phenylobacterium ferrooxidans TaxID=2982689 RepID=A0ABW6CM65_9CAUL
MSGDLTARLRIEANARQATAEVVSFGGAVESLQPRGRKAKAGLDEVASGARNVEGRMRGAKGEAAALGGVLGAIGVREVISGMYGAAQASAGFATGLGAVTGGAANANSAMGYVSAQALAMGLDVRTATNSFLGLAGATNGTALAGQQTREIWSGVMQAGLAMGRSNEQVQRGLEAISQVASKGVVSMEEIRQQLAEAIPGATNIAARAMGMGTAEFNKMVGAGKLLAEDFLPKFAAQLKSEFGPAVAKYLDSDLGRARVQIGLLKTDLFSLSAVGGEAFLGGVVAGLADLHDSLGGDTVEQVRTLARELGELVGAGARGLGLLAENADKVAVVLAALVGLRAGAALAAIGAEALAAAEGVGLLAAATTALGGPLAIVLALAGGAAAAGLAVWGSNAASSADDARQLTTHLDALEASLAETQWVGGDAGGQIQALGQRSAAAQQLVESLTGKVGALADELYRVAAANKTAAINQMMAQVATAQGDVDRLKAKGNREALFAGVALGFRPTVAETSVGPQIAQSEAVIARAQARIKALNDTPLLDPKWNPPTAAAGSAGSATPTSKSRKAGRLADDLAADVVALGAYRDALKQGGAALDDWRIKDAGRQAVEQAGLAHKAAATAAEGALAAKIRAGAEESERLKLANDRVGAAIGLQRTAQLDTEALARRSVAAAQGEQALEALQVREAGLEALRQTGIETLDQLTAADRREAEAAVATAEARERQRQATEKAERVAGTLQDLDRRIASERARGVAIQGGTRAVIAYGQAEEVRQQIEQVGKTLTLDQVVALRDKLQALQAIQAANDNADFARQQADELQLLRLTNREREIEQRYRELSRQNQLAQNRLTEDELRLRARLANDAEDNARAVGQLGDAVRDEFIRSGKLGFDDVADYAEQQLRAALYDALLKEPITLAIQAVVKGVSGLSGAIPGLGGLGAIVGQGGTGAAIGQAMGLGTGNAGLDMGLGMAGAALGSAVAGSALSGAIGAGIANGIIGLGGSAALAGSLGTMLSSAAVLGPIGAIAILAAATLFKKKPSNNGAQADLTDTGFTLTGSKRTAETTAMATNAANAVLQGEAMLKAAGITLNATVKSLDLGTRDATDIVLSDGRAFTSAVGDAAAAAETGLKAVLATATFKDDAQKALVEGLLAAGKGFDDIAAALGQLGAAQAIPQAIADAILKLTDPKGYDVAQLGKSQAARRKEVEDAAGAGYLTAAQLRAVNEQLTRLEALELDEVMKRFGAAADKAADNLSADLNEGFLKILNPAAYQQARGVREINDQIEAMKASAQQLIASGQVGAEVLGRIDALRDLQLADLARQVADTADTFADARRGLRQWLDGLSMSASAELSPVAQRAQALADYQRVLSQARGGDVNAAGQVTTYADRLLGADREATDNAQARLALYNQVRADIEGVAAGGGASANPVAAQLQALGIPLDKLVLTGALTAAANDDVAKAITPSLAVSVANIPTLKLMYGEIAATQGDRLVAAIETLRTDLKAAIAELGKAQGAGSTAAQAALEAALNSLGAGFDYLGGLTAEQTATLIEMRRTGQIAGAAARFQQVA